eukprot:TRINITY_DN3357_c0_g4_i1.p1 TRINITY_DN3357_c0_g4~~TRINITY_DN3357_c0_g4_i1.p1  ORF type:complete len:275 (-),score=74.23 TRINITY_DN3357_c0_g4_i1:128-952(-)
MEILLDSSIKNWVFIPIIVFMLLISLLRQYIGIYMANKKEPEKETSDQALKEKSNTNLLAYAKSLENNCGVLPETSFKLRKHALCKENDGLLYRKVENAAANPMQMGMPGMPGMPGGMFNKNSMISMQLNNLTMIVFSALQYGWIAHFFSEFLIGKVPIPLTQKFREMLQRGIDIQNLDVKYISAQSLYFLILFGLMDIRSLLFRNTTPEEEKEFATDMTAMTGMNPNAMNPMQMGTDWTKQFADQRDNIELTRYSNKLKNVEDEAIRVLSRDL